METFHLSAAAAYLSSGFSIGVAGLGVALALALVYSKTVEAISRQPEMVGILRTFMFIGFAFIEAIALYALVVSFLLLQKA